MKKLFAFTLVAVFSLPLLQAQESMFNLGDKVVCLGIGLGSSLYSGSYYTKGFPPLSLSYNQAVKDDILENGVIGIVGSVGYSSYKYDYLGWGYKYTNIFIGAGGTFHYPVLDKLDTYAGLMLGYNIVTANEFGTSSYGWDYHSNSSTFAFVGFVGARYYFSEQFAAFAQLGYGISYFTFGVCLKL